VAPSAVRALKKSPPDVVTRVREALEKLARDVAEPGRVPGKTVKTIRGTSDSFHRLRVGDYRVMFDVLDQDRTILVLGVVHRGDLDRWIRGR
jgi:mRNA interferase RelE/StbE